MDQTCALPRTHPMQPHNTRGMRFRATSSCCILHDLLTVVAAWGILSRIGHATAIRTQIEHATVIYARISHATTIRARIDT